MNPKDSYFIMCCPICGIELILPPPKPRRRGCRPERTEVWCRKCGGYFSYSGRLESHKNSSPTGSRRFCIYPKIPNIIDQREAWEKRLKENSNFGPYSTNRRREEWRKILRENTGSVINLNRLKRMIRRTAIVLDPTSQKGALPWLKNKSINPTVLRSKK